MISRITELKQFTYHSSCISILFLLKQWTHCTKLTQLFLFHSFICIHSINTLSVLPVTTITHVPCILSHAEMPHIMNLTEFCPHGVS